MANNTVVTFPSIGSNNLVYPLETSVLNIIPVIFPNTSSGLQNPFVIAFSSPNKQYVVSQNIANCNLVGVNAQTRLLFAETQNPFVSSNLVMNIPQGSPVRTIYPNLPTGNKYPNST